MNLRIDDLKHDMDTRFDEARGETNRRFDETYKRIDGLNNRIDDTNNRIDDLRSDMDRRFAMMTWMTAAWVTILIVLISVFKFLI